jgi:sensor histidine kinase YesM
MEHRRYKVQFVLSMVSIFITLVLSLICLFHWILSPVSVFTTLMFLGPLLLVLAFLILLLRARMITDLAKSRMAEHRKLVIEVQELIDEKKRERIREGKRSRGEDPDE